MDLCFFDFRMFGLSLTKGWILFSIFFSLSSKISWSSFWLRDVILLNGRKVAFGRSLIVWTFHKIVIFRPLKSFLSFLLILDEKCANDGYFFLSLNTDSFSIFLKPGPPINDAIAEYQFFLWHLSTYSNFFSFFLKNWRHFRNSAKSPRCMAFKRFSSSECAYVICRLFQMLEILARVRINLFVPPMLFQVLTIRNWQLHILI